MTPQILILVGTADIVMLKILNDRPSEVDIFLLPHNVPNLYFFVRYRKEWCYVRLTLVSYEL